MGGCAAVLQFSMRSAAMLVLCCMLSVQASLAAKLICDGQLRRLELAEPPFPSGPPWTPWQGPEQITCSRPDKDLGLACGSMRADFCQSIQFSPALQSSGPTPGIISPRNPLVFTIDDASSAYITFAQFTAGDIGTGGALVKGVYKSGSPLPNVTTAYQWVKNGPTVLPDGNVLFGVCSDCRPGVGVKEMAVRALPGAGFRSLEISQLYPDTRCEGSGVNNDGIIWDGIDYTCAEPTCGDTRLDLEGQQQFAGCEGGLLFNPDAKDAKPPSKENCCIRAVVKATCGQATVGGSFTCPDGWQYDPSTGGSSPPSTETCCMQTTCSNITPVTAFGQQYKCPTGYEYDNSMDAATPPSTTACCKVATCADTRPASQPGTAFSCESGTVLKPDAGSITPASQDTCCLRKTCGSPNPSNPTQGFACKQYSELDPAQLNTSPPSQQACCRDGTCRAPNPISAPTVSFPCPSDTEYDPNTNKISPPSKQLCCRLKTCSNMNPITAPGTVKFTCSVGTMDDPEGVNRSPPSQANCCKAFEPTCANINPSKPGVQFDCIGLRLFPNSSWAAANLPASAENCCFNLPVPPATDADVYVVKTVKPAIDRLLKVSTLEVVGFDFNFTLTVGNLALKNPDRMATDVVLTDRLPRGLKLKRVIESPNENACKYTLTSVTCTWPAINGTDVKTVVLVVTAVEAGVWLNTAEVTTSSEDFDLTNNRDNATVNVAGACCINGQMCVNKLPEGCKSPDVFERTRNCNTADCFSNPSTPGACCATIAGAAICTNNVPQKDCKGSWFELQPCSEITCKGPTGACCSVPDGTCRDGVTRLQCPNQFQWKQSGKCGKDNFCVGSCCKESTGECKIVTKNTCAGQWTFYGQCDVKTCPPPDVCVPPWWSCTPGFPDPCCEGYSCQPTYPKCVVGPHVCKPKEDPCVPDGSPCGGHKGGCCCKGSTCTWDYKKGVGVCGPLYKQCTSQGGTCRSDSDCCRGSRCKKPYGKKKKRSKSTCHQISYGDCRRQCYDYECYNERQKDCDCFYAAAASL